MRFKIINVYKSLFLHYIDNKEALFSKNFDLIFSDPNMGNFKKVRLPISRVKKILASSRLISRLLRLGVYHFFPVNEERYVIFADRKIFIYDKRQDFFKVTFYIKRGKRPLKNGVCVDAMGNIYWGEYWLNPKREEVYIYKSEDKGETWFPVYKFPKGKIRHVHALQYDLYTGYLWVATGDKDHESMIGYSVDGGKTFKFIGSGSQIWRTMSLIFTEDAIYWGMDSPDPPYNVPYIIRYDRREKSINKILRLPGPAYYSVKIGKYIIITTGKEFSKVEEDEFLHVIISADGKKWNDLLRFEKDMLPAKYFGHGIIYFPIYGNVQSSYIYFNLLGVKKFDNSLIIGKII